MKLNVMFIIAAIALIFISLLSLLAPAAPAAFGVIDAAQYFAYMVSAVGLAIAWRDRLVGSECSGVENA